MYWTQWKNRQLPLGDHKRNISLLPSTCDWLSSTPLHTSWDSIYTVRQSRKLEVTSSLLTFPSPCHQIQSVTMPRLFTRGSLGALVLCPQWLRSSGQNTDLQLHSGCADNPGALLLPRAPSLSPSYRLITFHPFHWNSPTATANPAGSPRCFPRPLLGCSNLEEFWTGHSLKM